MAVESHEQTPAGARNTAMNLVDFIHKWTASTRTERAASQEHFIDLCRVLGEPTPNEADPHGDFYAFEKGTGKVGGGEGFADVWLKDHFGWEYKGKRKSLKDAYEQLLQYHESLESPPLLVVCDLDRFEVHTKFTGTAKRVYAFALADLPNPEPTPTCPLPPLDVLRRLFKNPGSLRPEQTTAQVTERAAAEFATLAQRLHSRGESAETTGASSPERSIAWASSRTVSSASTAWPMRSTRAAKTP